MPAIFQNCTHLAIQHTSTDISPLSYVLSLAPTVTHFALLYTFPRIYGLRNAEAFFAKNSHLTIIVLAQFIKKDIVDAWEKEGITSYQLPSHKFEAMDARVALIEILRYLPSPSTNWSALAKRSLNIWDLGRMRLEELAAQKRELSHS
ncbi:hypothetical protein SISNIDRAFT_470638 [Sistotremastrum niveocremeum HHB9708]|uniref:Uncharacterized protein n=1 Tax=Sistotremastrum niveocremeum HHB9708 TaxID=1314777 RepID=A0A164NP22_9AGAM|nr:hypothetical protein SISNIDRAFT_470638 [Sistotremastrum niveocremeum HHB9708]